MKLSVFVHELYAVASFSVAVPDFAILVLASAPAWLEEHASTENLDEIAASDN